MKLVFLLLALLPLFFLQAPAAAYRCSPCGRDCDKEVHTEKGSCTHCGMPLVDAATITNATVQAVDVCNWVAKHPGALLLDVRTPDEFNGKADPDFGTLKGAINIPLQDFKNRMGELAPYRNKPILVYCSHSHRSSEISYRLTQAGFKQVTNMAGGMSVLPRVSCKK